LPIKDVGLAIILLTIVIRFILLPLTWTAMKSQRVMQSKNAEMKAIKDKYKDNQQEQSKALMKFYKDNGINPLSSCLPMLVQLPIMIALYQVLRDMNNEHWNLLYSFVARPDSLNIMFLNLIDLTKPYWPLAIMTGVTQFVYSWFLQNPKTNEKPKIQTKNNNETFDAENITSMMSKQFLYMMPLMTVFIAWNLMSGLGVYWVTTTVFNIIFQLVIIKIYPINNNSGNNEVLIENAKAEKVEWENKPEILETSKNNNITVSVKKRQQ
jgi:YidC/Oxa1 family membrane protein insertase